VLTSMGKGGATPAVQMDIQPQRVGTSLRTPLSSNRLRRQLIIAREEAIASDYPV
jgi:hypothetical protein